MTKRLHVGRAAEGGLLAALMAKEGITGPQAVFDDVWGGFFRTYAHGPTDVDVVTRGLGEKFSILRCAVKPYAACRDIHAAVDAIDRLLVRHGLAADDVASINVRLNAFLDGKVGGHDVSTLPAAQMSLPYAVAARIVFGEAGLAAYAPERRADPSLIDLVQRVIIERDEAVRESDASDVTLVARDGQMFREPTRTALGDPANPLTDEQILAKFRGLASLALPKDRIDALACTVLELRSQEDVRQLAALTVPG